MKARINWQTEISGMQSRNNFLQVGGQIIFGSSGSAWNNPDPKDGVYSIDPDSGRVNWFIHSNADVNEIALINGVILAPTDDGDLLFIDSKSGNILNQVSLGAASFGAPTTLVFNGQRHALIATHTGAVFLLDVNRCKAVLVAELNVPIRSSLLVHGESVLAFSETGLIIGLSPSNDWASELLCNAPIGHFGGPSGIAVAPLKAGNRLYVGYVRETYYDDPPLFCFDLDRHEIVWEARSRSKNYFGNLRASPTMVGGSIAIAPAYSDSLLFVSPRTGQIESEIVVGQSTFQQWSGPAKLSNRFVALGRVDGVCSIVDAKKRRLTSSISLVTAQSEKSFSKQHADGVPPASQLFPGEPAPEGGIVGKLLHTGSALFVGTTDGQIARIELSWIE